MGLGKAHDEDDRFPVRQPGLDRGPGQGVRSVQGQIPLRFVLLQDPGADHQAGFVIRGAFDPSVVRFMFLEQDIGEFLLFCDGVFVIYLYLLHGSSPSLYDE